jgi:hypothetical protein
VRIFPQDLSERWHLDLLRRRTIPGINSHAFAAAQPPSDKPLGWLGRFWTAGFPLPPGRAAKAIRCMPQKIILPTVFSLYLGFMGTAISMGFLKESGNPGAAFVVLPLVWSLAALLLTMAPRSSFRNMHQRAISPEEVDGLLEKCQDDLEREFLHLLHDVTCQPANEETETAVVTAIGAIQKAMERLPAIPVSPLDAADLREQASELLESARLEPDTITASSIERRAQAILHRVAANEQSSLLARRSSALRAEIMAQILALREGVAALQVNSPDFTGLGELAQAAQRVASEAAGVAEARAELEGAISSSTPVAAAVATAVVHY